MPGKASPFPFAGQPARDRTSGRDATRDRGGSADGDAHRPWANRTDDLYPPSTAVATAGNGQAAPQCAAPPTGRPNCRVGHDKPAIDCKTERKETAIGAAP